MSKKNEKLIKIISQFKNKKILVVGDIMLDKYIWGDVTRISPEAPVQVVSVQAESYAPGGAANVANNIAAFGSDSYMSGIVGKDIANEILLKEMRKRNIKTEYIITDEKKPTIQKVRVIGQRQQLLRIDYEKGEYLSKEIENKILDFVTNKIKGIDGVVISDYAKGVITKNLMMNIIKLCKGNKKIVTIDPKPQNKKFYKDATLITPNCKEASEMTNIEPDSEKNVLKIGKKILKELKAPVLITRGEKGMTLFETNGKVMNIPTKAKEVYDVTGAGDTVVATVTLALTSGATLRQAAIIANHAAGVVVGKVGTSTLSINELKQSLENE
ncbi:D-glycero-beta-D-manno-heptose-7-phosphate kinase [Candidatus Woesearchaeota archaeon]|nr:D-glycero-beta-D-manno-heptose-7-phosphate kinase [Candidatus Woesearchaeota archaeon]